MMNAWKKAPVVVKAASVFLVLMLAMMTAIAPDIVFGTIVLAATGCSILLLVVYISAAAGDQTTDYVPTSWVKFSALWVSFVFAVLFYYNDPSVVAILLVCFLAIVSVIAIGCYITKY